MRTCCWILYTNAILVQHVSGVTVRAGGISFLLSGVDSLDFPSAPSLRLHVLVRVTFPGILAESSCPYDLEHRFRGTSG